VQLVFSKIKFQIRLRNYNWGGYIASRGSMEPKKSTRKCCELEWDVYDDHTQKARTGWAMVQQPWSAKIAMQFVGFPHFDRLWPRHCHERHCRVLSVNYHQLEDVEIKWRYLTILRNIFNLAKWPKGTIPKSVVCIKYAEHVLRVRVDWSNLTALSERKFGGLGIAYTKCIVSDIPYTPVPEWFMKNPKLVDEPGGPISEGWEPKMIRHVGPTDNDMETVMGRRTQTWMTACMT
jgi:hypothetical protein